jgi:hypothetical protein
LSGICVNRGCTVQVTIIPVENPQQSWAPLEAFESRKHKYIMSFASRYSCHSGHLSYLAGSVRYVSVGYVSVGCVSVGCVSVGYVSVGYVINCYEESE